MLVSDDGYSEALYPIGALAQRDVADIKLDPLCADTVGIDALMDEWRAKAETYRSRTQPPLDARDSDVLPMKVSPAVSEKIQLLLSSYRPYLPIAYDLGFVPVSKLVMSQRRIELEHARESFEGISRKLSDDENAEYCLGQPIRDVRVEAAYLGSPKGSPSEFNYQYQFSSDDPNLRYIPAMPLKPFQDLDLSEHGSPYHWNVKAATVSVGPGLPFLHVLKVRSRASQFSREPLYRLILSNGFHRAFRLAELGNTHVAAMVQSIDWSELPELLIETPRDALLGPSPPRLTDLTDPATTRTFKWKRSKRVIRLQLRITQEVSFVG